MKKIAAGILAIAVVALTSVAAEARPMFNAGIGNKVYNSAGFRRGCGPKRDHGRFQHRSFKHNNWKHHMGYNNRFDRRWR